MVSVFNIVPTVSVAAATKGTCGTNATWEYTASTQTLTIKGTGATKDYNAILSKAPWESYKPNIVNLVVEEGITEIGQYNFFNCVALKNVKLPSTIKTLAGFGTISLTSDTQSARYGCFQECTALESIVLPEGLETIENCAFFGCTALKKIVFPNSLKKLAYGAFCDCSALTSVTFGSGLTEVGSYCFTRCTSLKTINWGDNMTSVSDYCFYKTAVTVVDLPERFTSVGRNSFEECYFLAQFIVNNPNCTFKNDATKGSQQEVIVKGYKLSTAEKYATDYGYRFVALGSCNHDSTHDEEPVVPTCTTPGVLQTICDECGAVVAEKEIKAFGHDLKLTDTADHTEIDGHIYELYNCKRCDYTQTKPVHQAEDNSAVVKKYIWKDGFYEIKLSRPATCTQPGAETYSCTVEGCNAFEVKATLPSHTVETWTVTTPATCTEDGTETGVCTVCGEETTRTIKATGHDYSNLVEDLDRTEDDGHIHHIYLCPNCNTQVSVYEHVEGVWVEGTYTATVVTQPQCVLDGLEIDTCNICKKTRTVTLKATGSHDWQQTSTSAPTCTAAGKINYTCSVCGREKIPADTIPALGHDYVKQEIDSKEPTCTEDGRYVYKCSRCNASKSETIPALGHSPDEARTTVITHATCEEAGRAVSFCTRCSVQYDMTLTALGHDYVDVEEDLTAENKPGHVMVTPICSRCHDRQTGKMVHKEWLEGYYTTTDEALAPTCAVDGYSKDKCDICNETRRNPIPKLGHLFVYTGNRMSQSSIGSGTTADEISPAKQLVFMCKHCGLPTRKFASEIVWDPMLADTVPNRTIVDDSCYLDLNGDGIINGLDYAYLRVLKKTEQKEIDAAQQNPVAPNNQ